VVSWEEFKAAFRAHHIPEGLIERKLNEFLVLTQGTRTVMQYAQAFNHLCQYASHHVDTDAKKRDRFHRGLNTKLRERLNLARADTFNELVNMAITQEDCISAHRAEKKRRITPGPSGTQQSRFRLVPQSATRPPPRTNLPGRWVARPPRQSQFNRQSAPPQQQQTAARP
jgi:phage terminase small subunit